MCLTSTYAVLRSMLISDSCPLSLSITRLISYNHNVNTSAVHPTTHDPQTGQLLGYSYPRIWKQALAGLITWHVSRSLSSSRQSHHCSRLVHWPWFVADEQSTNVAHSPWHREEIKVVSTSYSAQRRLLNSSANVFLVLFFKPCKVFLHMKPQPQSVLCYMSQASIRSTMECEEINDLRVRGQDVSQIHINRRTNTLRMCDYGVTQTHKVLLCLHNWNESMYGQGRDLKTNTGISVLNFRKGWFP